MVTRGGNASLRIGADISGALQQLERLQNRGRQVGRTLNNLSGGSLGAVGRTAGGGIGRAGRAGAAVGNIAIAGAGLSAGFAIFENLVERLLEVFEDTDILDDLTMAFQTLFVALGPLVGVLLTSLTPVVAALAPAIAPLAEALAPLIEILGVNLLLAVQLLTPLIQLVAKGIDFLATRLRDFVFGLLERIGRALSRIPGVNIDLSGFQQDQFGEAQRQLAQGRDRREAQERLDALADAISRQAEERARVEEQAAALPEGSAERRRLEERARELAEQERILEQRRLRTEREVEDLAQGAERRRLDDRMREIASAEREAANRQQRQQTEMMEQIIRIENRLTIDGEAVAVRVARTNQYRHEGGL